MVAVVSEAHEVREYKQGDTVRLTVEMQDDHGIYSGFAVALLLVDGVPDRKTQLHRLALEGGPEGEPPRAEFVLSATIEQEQPGVYVCDSVITENSWHAMKRHDLNPPKRFRIVEHPDDVREGPDLLAVSDFW